MKKILLIALLILPLHSALAAENYMQLRSAFANEKDFNPYSLQLLEKGLISDAMVEWRSGKAIPAVNKLRELVDVYPYSIEGHRRLADAYKEILKQVKDPKQHNRITLLEKKHRNTTTGILKSIINSGDGHTPETAYKVITISEEYMTLFFLGLRAKAQSKQPNTGTKVIDVMEVEDKKGKLRKVYFELI